MAIRERSPLLCGSPSPSTDRGIHLRLQTLGPASPLALVRGTCSSRRVFTHAWPLAVGFLPVGPRCHGGLRQQRHPRHRRSVRCPKFKNPDGDELRLLGHQRGSGAGHVGHRHQGRAEGFCSGSPHPHLSRLPTRAIPNGRAHTDWVQL